MKKKLRTFDKKHNERKFNSRYARHQRMLVGMVSDGMPITTAFIAVGLGRGIYESWKGKSDRFERDLFNPDAEENPTHEKYYQLFEKLRQVESLWFGKLVERSLHRDITVCDWKRDLSILERRDRDNWSKDRTVVIGSIDVSDTDDSFL